MGIGSFACAYIIYKPVNPRVGFSVALPGIRVHRPLSSCCKEVPGSHAEGCGTYLRGSSRPQRSMIRFRGCGVFCQLPKFATMPRVRAEFQILRRPKRTHSKLVGDRGRIPVVDLV